MRVSAKESKSRISLSRVVRSSIFFRRCRMASQLIAQFHVGQIGPENSRTYDGGIDQELWNGRARLGLTYFHNEFTNGIEFVPQSGLARTWSTRRQPSGARVRSVHQLGGIPIEGLGVRGGVQDQQAVSLRAVAIPTPTLWCSTRFRAIRRVGGIDSIRTFPRTFRSARSRR